MTNTKHTKRALLSAVLALTLCVSLLVGTTFAWFTDTATTAVNKIQAGKLTVDLVDADGNTLVGQTLNFKKAEGAESETVLWEPGCTYELEDVFVKNKGDLWLEYDIVITGINGYDKLNEVIDWTITLPENGVLAPGATSEKIAIKGHMLETAGNDYQGLTIENVAITVLATQAAKESDSINSTYDENAPTTITIGDVAYDTLNEAVTAAKNGDVINLSWGTFQFPTADMKNKEITFAGTEYTTIDATAVDYRMTLTYVEGSTIKFDGVTVNWANKNEGYQGFAHSAKVEYKDCTITGTQFMYGDADFTNCTFITLDGYDNGYNVYGRGAGTLTFTDCTFKTGGRAIMLFQDQTTEVNVKMTNCVFYDNGAYTSKPKAVVETGDGAYKTSKFNIEITDCKACGFETNNSTSVLWGNKDNIPADRLNVVIDGNNVSTNVNKYTITTAEELKNILTMAGTAGAENSIIELTADVELKEAWTPVNVDGYHGADIITLNGNGHTISGLTAPLFAGGFAGGSGIVINDLTIQDSTIVSTKAQGSGAFIETVDSMDVITLNNCHLKNSTVKGSRTGGLIGWTSGYNNTNDGAVKTYVTVKDCSVIGCTIENTFSDEGTTPHTESVGAIFGHAGANPWTFTTIEDCIIADNTILGGNGKTGVILGTANVGEVTITDCEMNDNTVNGVASDKAYGRVAFGTTGKLTIDGESITA